MRLRDAIGEVTTLSERRRLSASVATGGASGRAARVRSASREELQDAFGKRLGATVFGQLQSMEQFEEAIAPGDQD